MQNSLSEFISGKKLNNAQAAQNDVNTMVMLNDTYNKQIEEQGLKDNSYLFMPLGIAKSTQVEKAIAPVTLNTPISSIEPTEKMIRMLGYDIAKKVAIDMAAKSLGKAPVYAAKLDRTIADKTFGTVDNILNDNIFTVGSRSLSSVHELNTE